MWVCGFCLRDSWAPEEPEQQSHPSNLPRLTSTQHAHQIFNHYQELAFNPKHWGMPSMRRPSHVNIFAWESSLCLVHICPLAAFKHADAEGESGPVWPVEELQRLCGGRGCPLWLVYPGESVRNSNRFLSLQTFVDNVNCALPHLPLPLLPDRANLIMVRFSVMHMPRASWHNKAGDATLLSVGGAAAVAVCVGDRFRLILISKPRTLRLMGRRNEFSIYKYSNQENDWDSFVGFHYLHSDFTNSCRNGWVWSLAWAHTWFAFHLALE